MDEWIIFWLFAIWVSIPSASDNRKILEELKKINKHLEDENDG